MALAVAIVILTFIGGVALLNLFSGSEPPVVTQPDSPATTISPAPINPSLNWQGYWPQNSLEEIELDQQRADDGDRSFDWQIGLEPTNEAVGVAPTDPGGEVGAETAVRYLEEVLGWTDYRMVAGGGSEGEPWDLVFVQCEPDTPNPMYISDPAGADCAPTLDQLHYRTAKLRLEQPIRQGAGGLWVVTSVSQLADSAEPLYFADWHSRQYEQVVPATEEELRDFVEGVSEARVAGTGAEQYLMPLTPGASLLYTTSSGLPYESFELVRVDWGPTWPDGTYRVIVRMLGAGGGVVVEQAFLIHQEQDGELRLDYGLGEGTENGEPVALTYGILAGEITWRVPDPWFSPWMLGVVDGDESIVVGGVEAAEVYFVVLGDPWIPEGQCAPTARRGSADELVAAIVSDPDLDVSASTDVIVGGVQAVRLDLAPSTSAEMCPGSDESDSAGIGMPVVSVMQQGDEHPWSVTDGDRMRIYLLDVPGPDGLRPVAIMIRAPDEVFGEALTAAEPMIGSFVFESP